MTKPNRVDVMNWLVGNLADSEMIRAIEEDVQAGEKSEVKAILRQMAERAQKMEDLHKMGKFEAYIQEDRQEGPENSTGRA